MSKLEYAVEVKNVKKSFYLPNHKNNSLKQAITQVFKKKEKGGDSFDALKDISFNVEKGDFFGVLGRNGSGKSTLLKIISDIYQPSSGSVKHNGKLVAFIELGVGFKAELSGRDNVYLNGALLGFSKKEIEAMYDEIVEFAELEMFMDQKLKNYSSGMKVRLAFSVAIQAKADILILDEVLAVGDADFQRKCYNYFSELKEANKTIIFVSHSMGLVRQYCNKAVLIEGGKITHAGPADEVADEYTKLFEKRQKPPTLILEDDGVEIDHTFSLNKDILEFHLNVLPLRDIKDAVIGVTLKRDTGDWIYRWATDNTEVAEMVNLQKGNKISFNIEVQNIFPDSEYTVDIWAKSRDRKTVHYAEAQAHTFRIRNKNHEGQYWKAKSYYEIKK